jgi:response regulator RpfG family c-di-GMP phosphodiesterase
MSTAKSIYQQLINSPLNSIFRPARILIVDDEIIVREILARKLASLGYECECCVNSRTALELMAVKRFDLVLADMLMPEMGGAAFLKESMRISPDIAVILVASVVDIEVAVDSLKDGAYDYITKPFSLEEVSVSVSRALEKRRLLIENQNYQRTLEEQVSSRTRQLQEALGVLEHTYHSTLAALSRALDSRDADSDGHSLRVTIYTKRLAQNMGFEEQRMRVIEQGVLLHDIGKIGIPDDLLRKPGNLTEEEWKMVRKHPEIGFRILSSIKFLRGAAKLVLHHHERYDGKGYPLHLSGDEIDLGARIFAVADALDDLTSNRPFQAAISFEEAVDEIKRMSGSQLDPKLVDEFLKIPISEWKQIREAVAANNKRSDFLRIATGHKN